MIRCLNIALIVVTAIACLGLYRIAEEARIAQAELRATQSAIVDEQNAIAVLGAEWARVTQPARISALVAKHLPLADEPTLQLSSMRMLPPRALVPADEPIFRTASIVVREPNQGHNAATQDVTLASYSGM
jgi:hypothetical protein